MSPVLFIEGSLLKKIPVYLLFISCETRFSNQKCYSHSVRPISDQFTKFELSIVVGKGLDREMRVSWSFWMIYHFQLCANSLMINEPLILYEYSSNLFIYLLSNPVVFPVGFSAGNYMIVAFVQTMLAGSQSLNLLNQNINVILVGRSNKFSKLKTHAPKLKQEGSTSAFFNRQ